MSDWVNNSSIWLSITAILISVPLGILANLVTPKVRGWLAMQTTNSITKQIIYLENLVIQTDRLVSEPSFAIAKFTNIALRAIIGQIGVNMFFAVIILGGINLLSKQESSLITIAITIPVVFMFIAGMFLVAAASYRTMELYAMTHRVEKYVEWKKETLAEIKSLNRRLLSMQNAKNN
jgi:hypothetical protein